MLVLFELTCLAAILALFFHFWVEPIWWKDHVISACVSVTLAISGIVHAYLSLSCCRRCCRCCVMRVCKRLYQRGRREDLRLRESHLRTRARSLSSEARSRSAEARSRSAEAQALSAVAQALSAEADTLAQELRDLHRLHASLPAPSAGAPSPSPAPVPPADTRFASFRVSSTGTDKKTGTDKCQFQFSRGPMFVASTWTFICIAAQRRRKGTVLRLHWKIHRARRSFVRASSRPHTSVKRAPPQAPRVGGPLRATLAASSINSLLLPFNSLLPPLITRTTTPFANLVLLEIYAFIIMITPYTLIIESLHHWILIVSIVIVSIIIEYSWKYCNRILTSTSVWKRKRFRFQLNRFEPNRLLIGATYS